MGVATQSINLTNTMPVSDGATALKLEDEILQDNSNETDNLNSQNEQVTLDNTPDQYYRR